MAEDNRVITLVSLDKEKFQAEAKVLKMSKTIKDLLEDTDADTPIDLPNVPGKTLAKVVEYCKQYTESNPDPKEEVKPEELAFRRPEELTEWENKFFEPMDRQQLFDLILAANFLNIEKLLNVSCKVVANQFKGKTPEALCEMLGCKYDITPEEEEEVRKENPWLDER